MPRLATRCIACDHQPLDRQPAILMPFVAQRALLWSPCEVTPEWGLRNIANGHAHARCTTLHCPACGMVFADMRFDDAEMARLYSGYRGPAYVAERKSFEPGYALRNQRLVAGDSHIPAVEALLAPWLPASPAVLDWGGDSGQNTPLRAKARVHDVLDISGKPTVPGARRLQAPEEGHERYDLIVLSNVLEHVPEPLPLLAQVVHRLAQAAPAARLYVEVPFEALMRGAVFNPQAWLSKRHWHEHVNFFSEAALRHLLARAGLEVLELQMLPLPEAAVQFAAVCGINRDAGPAHHAVAPAPAGTAPSTPRG